MKKLIILLFLIFIGSFAFAQFGPGYTNSGTYSLNRTNPRFKGGSDSNSSYCYDSSFSESDCVLLIELYDGELIKEAHDKWIYRGTNHGKGYDDFGSAYWYFKLNNGKILVTKYIQTYEWGSIRYIYEKGYYLNDGKSE